MSHDLITRCIAIAQENPAEATPVPTGIDDLTVVVAHGPSPLRATLYQPMICLVLQGAKEILHHDGRVTFGAGQTAIVSHELVTGARILQATPDRPYVALACHIVPEILRSLQAELEPDALVAARSDAVAAGQADRAVVDAMTRLLDLNQRPVERRVLDPLVRRELHFRVLLSQHGAMLRQLAQPGSPASRVARAISHIRQNWNNPLRTQELAQIAGMSPSSFHEHFKAVTATSPIQYQKSLRLVEARRLLAETGEAISSVAFSVGYESPTQFSRDYRRIHGMAPRETRLEKQTQNAPGPEQQHRAAI